MVPGRVIPSTALLPELSRKRNEATWGKTVTTGRTEGQEAQGLSPGTATWGHWEGSVPAHLPSPPAALLSSLSLLEDLKWNKACLSWWFPFLPQLSKTTYWEAQTRARLTPRKPHSDTSGKRANPGSHRSTPSSGPCPLLWGVQLLPSSSLLTSPLLTPPHTQLP